MARRASTAAATATAAALAPRPTIDRPARVRRYSVVELKFAGTRRLSTGSSTLPSHSLRVVPQVSDVLIPAGDVASLPLFPASTCRPLTIEEASVSGPLLARGHLPANGKLTLVLDLDETLIHAAVPQMQATADVAHDFSFLIEGDARQGHHAREVIVWKRPGLSEFLRRAAQIANIVVFTASVKGTERWQGFTGRAPGSGGEARGDDDDCIALLLRRREGPERDAE